MRWLLQNDTVIVNGKMTTANMKLRSFMWSSGHHNDDGNKESSLFCNDYSTNNNHDFLLTMSTAETFQWRAGWFSFLLQSLGFSLENSLGKRQHEHQVTQWAHTHIKELHSHCSDSFTTGQCRLHQRARLGQQASHHSSVLHVDHGKNSRAAHSES